MEAELQGPKATGDRVTEAVTHVQYAATIGDREAIACIRHRDLRSYLGDACGAAGVCLDFFFSGDFTVGSISECFIIYYFVYL